MVIAPLPLPSGLLMPLPEGPSPKPVPVVGPVGVVMGFVPIPVPDPPGGDVVGLVDGDVVVPPPVLLGLDG